MKIKYVFVLLPLMFSIACNSSQKRQSSEDKLKEQRKEWENQRNYDIVMDFDNKQGFGKGEIDTFHLNIKITKGSNIKASGIIDPKECKVTVFDLGKPTKSSDWLNGNFRKAEIELFSESGKTEDLIPEKTVFWLLVDRSESIGQNAENMKSAIKRTVDGLPQGRVFISFLDDDKLGKKMITSSNFYDFDSDFQLRNFSRKEYKNAIRYFEKFSQELHKDTVGLLLLFTDGIQKVTKETTDWGAKVVAEIDEIDNRHKDKNVYIYAFRCGMPNKISDASLIFMCNTRKEKNGNFYSVENTEGIMDSVRNCYKQVTFDYQLKLTNALNKKYDGNQHLIVFIEQGDNVKAFGEIKDFPIGLKYINEIETYTKGRWDEFWLIFVLGGISLFVIFFILQAVFPYIKCRIINFEKHYVKLYEPANNTTLEFCIYCGLPFARGEEIVTKCQHKIHHHCWKENGYKCPQYGPLCKDGIQYYFDKSHALQLKESAYWLKWVTWGMIGGFIAWAIFYFMKDWNLFSGFIDVFLKPPFLDNNGEWFKDKELLPYVREGLHIAVRSFWLMGILLGFIITFIFTYINEFQKRTGTVLLLIFARAFVGGIIGFLSFLIGSIVYISLKGDLQWMATAISFMLFGITVACCLSYKTTIEIKSALIGGLIAGVAGFFILLTAALLPSEMGLMFSFVACSAVLGLSIVVVHHAAQKYFLKYNRGDKEFEVPLHKWMSKHGGSNEVSIGKSNDCVIRMNWDESDRINGVQAKLYIDLEKNVPVFKAMTSDVIYAGKNVDKGKEFPLKDKVKFKIGNTEFEYIEK